VNGNALSSFITPDDVRLYQKGCGRGIPRRNVKVNNERGTPLRISTYWQIFDLSELKYIFNNGKEPRYFEVLFFLVNKIMSIFSIM